MVFMLPVILYAIVQTVMPHAFACSCAVPRPQVYKESTAIFVGKVIEKDGGSMIDGATHVTFDVEKSWKGVDAKTIKVHIDSPACSTAILENEDYLVYANLDLFEVRMPSCSGTSWMGNVEYLACSCHLKPNICSLSSSLVE